MTKLKIFIALVFFSLTGCEDYLDKAPEFGLTEEDVFLEFESARGFLDVNYDKLVDMHHWDGQNLRNNNITSLSDETASIISSGITVLNTGKWLNQPDMGEVGWTENSVTRRSTVIGRAFSCMRVANKVIENAETIPNITDEELNGLLGQAYFFRAWWYFQIIKRWGGMPIFDKALKPSDDMDFPRLTYSESTDWLVSDLDKATALLPHAWPNEQYGRATKGSAMALKSMAALYAASPLMKNGLQTLQNNGYDIAWAERAAQYAHEAIDYIQNGPEHRYRLMNQGEYNNIFYHEAWASDESLWFRMDGNTRATRDFTTIYLPRRIGNMSGKGSSAMNFSNPTQNIVDMYETADGYPIDHPGAITYNELTPYANRDPRLTNNILLPGEEWGINSKNKPLYIETYVGGIDYNQAKDFPVTANRMISGYACKKFVWPEANGYTKEYRKNTLNTIYIRVAQVYLDFAEAMNEAYGPTDAHGYSLSAVDAINVIRNRVGMPNVLSEFTASKEAFRKRIRNERAVELMFENHRWHDLRRWMIAEEVFKEPIKGVRATPIPGPPRTDFTYEVIPLTTEERVFSARQYWYPVAQNHVENLYNFQQNPGW